jgi:putative DNA-invertase from lambdoid prophage Rac
VIIKTVINGMTFDGATKDPVQKAVRDALIGFMAATAQAQAEVTKATQRAGIEHAKATDECAYLGRKPSFTRRQLEAAQDLLDRATAVTQIAKATGLTRETDYRIKNDPASCEAMLAAWGQKANGSPASIAWRLDLGAHDRPQLEENNFT